VAAMEGLIRAAEAETISFQAMEDAEGRVRRLQQRFLAGYRDPDSREARGAAERGEHRDLAERIAMGSGLPA
jgi:hypothetical protein